MPEDFDYEAFVKARKDAFAKAFRNPDAISFKKHYGFELPTALHGLYSLGEALDCTVGQIDTVNGSIWVQYIAPLTAEAVMFGAQYGWRYFPFASGGDGESFLVSASNPRVILVDYQSDATDIEETSIRFDDFLRELSRRLDAIDPP